MRRRWGGHDDDCQWEGEHVGPCHPLPVRSEPQAPGHYEGGGFDTVSVLAEAEALRAERDAYRKALSEIAEHTYDAPSDEWAVIKTRGIALAALARRSGETPEGGT